MKSIEIILTLRSELKHFFPDYAKSSNSLRGRDKFWIEVMNRLLDCLRVQIVKRSESYEYIRKRFKLLADLIQNTDIAEDNIKPIIMLLTMSTLMQN